MEVEFGFFKNEHLRKAFALRRNGDYVEAGKELRKGCEEDNDGESLYVMAETLWLGGFGFKSDSDSCKMFCERSSLAGCPWGIIDYAYFHNSMAEGNKQALYKKAFDSQDALARGMCYYRGLCVERNFEWARVCFLEALEQGNILAKLWMARVSDRMGSQFVWFKEAARDGDAEGQHSVGRCYEKGQGVREDKEKAFAWYWEGLRQQYFSSFAALGRFYEFGFGCLRDFTKSACYNLEAEEANNIHNQLTSYNSDEIGLRALFIYGRGFKKNEKLRSKIETNGEEGIIAAWNCTRIFEESCSSAQKAAMCFMWIFKRNNWLIRDLRRLIAEMIWKSREDPAIWGVDGELEGGEERENKRTKID